MRTNVNVQKIPVVYAGPQIVCVKFNKIFQANGNTHKKRTKITCTAVTS